MSSMSADSEFSKADNLIDAFRACDLTPLQGETMERYYVDLKQVRKTKAIAGVNARLKDMKAGACATLH